MLPQSSLGAVAARLGVSGDTPVPMGDNCWHPAGRDRPPPPPRVVADRRNPSPCRDSSPPPWPPGSGRRGRWTGDFGRRGPSATKHFLPVPDQMAPPPPQPPGRPGFDWGACGPCRSRPLQVSWASWRPTSTRMAWSGGGGHDEGMWWGPARPTVPSEARITQPAGAINGRPPPPFCVCCGVLVVRGGGGGFLLVDVLVCPPRVLSCGPPVRRRRRSGSEPRMWVVGT